MQKRPWPMSELETTLEVERLSPGKELVVRCMDTGTYTRMVLTEGQGGTFLEAEAGADPTSLKLKVPMSVIGSRLFRRWVDHALDGIRRAAEPGASAQTPTGDL